MTESTYLHRIRMALNKEDLFSPAELAKLGDKYKLFTSIKNTSTFEAGAFDAYAKNRAADFNVFKETKGPDEATSIPQSLKDTKDDDDETKESKQIVRTAITTALIATSAFTKAQQEYTTSIEEINARIANGSQETVSAIVNKLTNCVSDAGKAILNQQQTEMDTFKNLFSHEPFKKDFMNAIGTNSEEGFNKVKENMETELKNSHLKQLEEFDKSTCDSLIKMHNADAAEKNRLYLLATLHNNSETMRDIIDKKIKDKKNITGTQVSIREDENNALKIDLSGVEFNDKENFSLTGKSTNFGKNPDNFVYGGVTKTGQNSYTVALDNYVSLNLFYYLGVKKNVPVDFLTLASAMRGQKDIVITVEFDDPKLALQRGRQVYEAFILMGHDPKDIKELNINNRVYKLSPDGKNDKELSVARDLFKGHETEYAAIQEKAKANTAEFKKLGIAPKTFEEAKEEIKALREKGAPEQDPVDAIKLSTGRPK